MNKRFGFKIRKTIHFLLSRILCVSVVKFSFPARRSDAADVG
jgi:hypothetical protein